MSIAIRVANVDDSEGIAQVCAAAFSELEERQRIRVPIADIDIARRMVSSKFTEPDIYRVVAESSGIVVGFAFLDLREDIGQIGPIGVSPATQSKGAGKELVAAALRHADKQKVPTITLGTGAGNHLNLALYSQMGFACLALMAAFTGDKANYRPTDRIIRSMAIDDVDQCVQLSISEHGYSKGAEIRQSISQGSGRVVELADQITGYTTGINFFGHSVGRANDDLTALIATAESYGKPGFLVPASNNELMRWCLGNGLRISYQAILMVRGELPKAVNSYLPHI